MVDDAWINLINSIAGLVTIIGIVLGTATVFFVWDRVRKWQKEDEKDDKKKDNPVGFAGGDK